MLFLFLPRLNAFPALHHNKVLFDDPPEMLLRGGPIHHINLKREIGLPETLFEVRQNSGRQRNFPHHGDIKIGKLFHRSGNP